MAEKSIWRICFESSNKAVGELRGFGTWRFMFFNFSLKNCKSLFIPSVRIVLLLLCFSASHNSTMRKICLPLQCLISNFDRGIGSQPVIDLKTL